MGTVSSLMDNLHRLRSKNGLSNSIHLHFRICWGFALALLLGGMCWQLAIRVQEYLEFASDTELHEEFQSYIDFPAVSICNYNRCLNTAVLSVKIIDRNSRGVER